MRPEEFKAKQQQFNQALLTELPRINESIAKNAYALIRDRIINEGKKGDGSSLGKYSDTELPLFFYKGKSLNAGGEKAIEKAKKERRGLSYEDFREANNRPTDHKTFNFSGQMWRDIDVIKQQVQGGVIITTVGAKNTIARTSGNKTIDTDTIMEGLRDQSGDFLAVSQSEEDLLAITYDTELQKLIDKHF